MSITLTVEDRRILKDEAALRDVLDDLLDDGSGRVSPALQDLYWNLIYMPEPRRGLVWIANNRHVGEYLRGLARGDIPLTHAGLHGLASWRTAAHLRDLLMAAEILAPVDRQILLYERWCHDRLGQVPDQGHGRLLRQFVTWHQLPRLYARARTRPLSPSSRNYAAAQFKAAAAFLAWLAGRGRRPAGVTQGDLDDWHTTQPAHRAESLRGFLGWAIANRHLPGLTIPAHVRTERSPIDQHRRLALLRRALTDDCIPQRTRVAAVLLLLYAQPVARLVRLTIDDIITDGHEVLVRLGEPPTPAPEPFAALLLDYADHRANMRTATNPAARWLFPGHRADQPLTPGALLLGLRTLGAPAAQVRTAAFRQLVLQAPAPVVAGALGYHHGTATKHVAVAGGTWSRYPSAR